MLLSYKVVYVPSALAIYTLRVCLKRWKSRKNFLSRLRFDVNIRLYLVLVVLPFWKNLYGRPCSRRYEIKLSLHLYLAAIQREEEKAKQQLKAQAKKGQKEACTIIAKEILRTRKAVSKIHAAKAQLKSVEYSMNQQLGALQVSKSTKF